MGILNDLPKGLADTLYVAQYPRLITSIPGVLGKDESGPGANASYAARVIVPMNGNLRDVSFMVSGTPAGNYDIAVYDTTATTRNRLGSKGTTALGAASSWATYDPNIAVTAGQQIDLVVGFDNAGGKMLGQFHVQNGTSQLPSGFVVAPGGGVNRMAWNGFTYPLPSTFSEASMFSTFFMPLIIARIS